MIAILTGGTGGAKFVQGMVRALPPEDVTVIVNTGDDLRWWGLHVSPDLDSVTYALAGLLSRERGWGVEGDTFTCLERMRQLGAPAWFQLGDRDLATHLRRTELLATGLTLSQATAEITGALGIASRILPMTDDPVETRVLVESSVQPGKAASSKQQGHSADPAACRLPLAAGAEFSFQEYFVRERWQPAVHGVRFAGAEAARPAPGVLETIADAEAIFLAPSNPITSIGPILAVPGIRQALRETRVPLVAISPIIGTAAVSGPAGELMRCAGLPVSAAGVAQAYRDFLDVLLVDNADSDRLAEVDALGVHAVLAPAIMHSDDDKLALAQAALAAAEQSCVARVSDPWKPRL